MLLDIVYIKCCDCGIEIQKKSWNAIRCKTCALKKTLAGNRLRNKKNNYQYRRTYESKHAEKEKLRRTIWRKTDSGKLFKLNRNYSDRTGRTEKISLDEFKSIKEKYFNSCYLCCRKEPDIIITVDHIIPVSKGGLNTVDNIQLLCLSCNSKKGNKNTLS